MKPLHIAGIAASLFAIGGLLYVYYPPQYEVLDGGRVKIGSQMYTVTKGTAVVVPKRMGIYEITISNPDASGSQAYIQYKRLGRIVSKHSIEI